MRPGKESTAEASRARAAFEAIRDELPTACDADSCHLPLDVMVVIATAYDALPAIRALCATMRDGDGEARDVARLDKLETYVDALLFAHTRCLASARAADALPEHFDEAERLFDLLHGDAQALVMRGLLAADRLQALTTTRAVERLAFDLRLLADVLRSEWKVIAGATAIHEPALDQATRLSEQLSRSLVAREVASADAQAARMDRQRVLVSLLRAYDEARRAMAFARHRGDEARVVPATLLGQRRDGQ